MCGIFGAVGDAPVKISKIKALAKHAKQRGSDSSGIIWTDSSGRYERVKSDSEVTSLSSRIAGRKVPVVVGHSRLITNGMHDNQPIERGGVVVFHNGIVVNDKSIWKLIGSVPRTQSDTEVIAEIASLHLAERGSLSGVSTAILGLCKGSLSCVVMSLTSGELVLFSNTGSLFVGELDGISYFASERHPLCEIGVAGPEQVLEERVFKIAKSSSISLSEVKREREDLVGTPALLHQESLLLKFEPPNLRRCSRCILPDTMPFISFDESGVCIYCTTYKLRNKPKPASDLDDLLRSYRRVNGPEAIMPFSGGRDSSFALHLVTREFGMRTIAYTYDWGMVTDLGRRNISRMCGELGVENIVIAADISAKRRNISMNLKAWIAKPHLGMLSLLTAGDKHFFKFVETVKQQTGIHLNLWGVNPLETTHFKSGFLGVRPDFEMDGVYTSGLRQQLRYQNLRFREMLKNPRYLNSSLWDTLSGEYHRSVAERTDYFHIFDYWRWDEKEINDTLISEYGWEIANDTPTTWRIGDGTAAFYNYVYFQVGGFSEHDTFRSNQVREGDISREEALEIATAENRPRYESIKWYLNAAGVDFKEAIYAVNSIPKLYKS